MAGAVGDRLEQILRLPQYLQYLLREVYVGPFIISAYVVNCSYSAFTHDKVYRTAVVDNVNPVTHVEPVTIDRNWLVVQNIQDDSGKELLRMLPRPIVIAATRDDHGQPKSSVIRSNEQIGGGLAGSIGGVGAEGRILGKPLC